MSGAAQVYMYARESRAADGLVDLATSGGVALSGMPGHPYFFSGFLTRPAVAAEALRAVASVAASNFARRPPVALDPVVTSHGDRLRFESFSSCGGVQARLDLLPEGLDGDVLDRGTTNVDINEPLRRFLARVADKDTLRISVGSEELVVSGPGQVFVERKVRLPERWLRGFAEVQAIAAGFELRLEADGLSASRFFTSSRPKASGWVVATGRSWRLSSRASTGAAFLAGSDRLGALIPLLRHATRVRVYGPAIAAGATSAASAWELELPGCRLTFALSPDPYRGFSGEGAALTGLASEEVSSDADVVRAVLSFEPRLDIEWLAAATDIDQQRVRGALTQLAVSGQVGFDLAEGTYFHRVLPYDPTAVEALNPRLRDARALVTAGAVKRGPDGVFEVRSGEQTYRVRDRGATSHSCTCRWWTSHQGTRGPCKHSLAATLSMQVGSQAMPGVRSDIDD